MGEVGSISLNLEEFVEKSGGGKYSSASDVSCWQKGWRVWVAQKQSQIFRSSVHLGDDRPLQYVYISLSDVWIPYVKTKVFVSLFS